MKRRGFTLIELLVVIAIIAILAAILFPVFAQAREKGRQASCESNLKQVGLAIKMYVQDYDEKWPGGMDYPTDQTSNGQQRSSGLNFGFNGWVANVIRPYVKNEAIYLCPSIQGSGGWADPWVAPGGPATAGPPLSSYAYNYASLNGVQEAIFPAESTAIVMADSNTSWWDCAYMSTCGMVATRDWQWHLQGNHILTEWHTGKNDNLFADGHVKAMGCSQIVWQNIATMIQPACDIYNQPLSVVPNGGDDNNSNCQGGIY